ncbi:ANTAR domain protein with unknown sensor [Kribbella flavida DSM 17836]|uniref:ANTAR domain-containing protein n=1 Tax=Kribbella flavida (strain DSM 17836 / JCM 10339 / NBRC 14399) TaxID=479435 RepID=D2PTX5_KRIFD|nr:ANTAR domain-containing protein [Kribbella flavida]ADB33258.1 ANTAR domain protein with unknown sensor [Kribbella flavida DSM 17836]
MKHRSSAPHRDARFHWLVPVDPSLDLGLEFVPGLLIGSLAGHLRDRSSDRLRSTFRDALAQRPERVLLDFAGLVSLEEQALAGLLGVLDHARSTELPVAVASPLPGQREVVGRVSARQQRAVLTFQSLDEAVAGVMAVPGAPLPDQETLLAEVRNLHRAMMSRACIDQAKGILMAVYGLDDAAAFAMLVWHSRRSGLALRVLAERFVETVRARGPAVLTPHRTDAILAELADRGRRYDRAR